MQYRISDVARILGITPNALHFFEKENIIRVEKDQSGYRNYSIADVFRLLSYGKYRSMGYPLKTIKTQFSHEIDNKGRILQRMEEMQEEALKKASYYTQLARTIEEHIAQIREIDTLLGKYEVTQANDLLFVFDPDGGWISKHKPTQQILHQWVDAMPSVRLAFLDDAPKSTPEEGDARGTLAYLAEASAARELRLPSLPHMYKQTASPCLHTIVAADDSFLEDPASVFTDIYREAQQRGLTPAGRPWGTILLVEIRPDGGLRPYHSLWLPVKL